MPLPYGHASSMIPMRRQSIRCHFRKGIDWCSWKLIAIVVIMVSLCLLAALTYVAGGCPYRILFESNLINSMLKYDLLIAASNMVNWYQGTKACTVLVGDGTDGGKSALDGTAAGKNSSSSSTPSSSSAGGSGAGGKRQQSGSGGNSQLPVYDRKRRSADYDEHDSPAVVVNDFTDSRMHDGSATTTTTTTSANQVVNEEAKLETQTTLSSDTNTRSIAPINTGGSDESFVSFSTDEAELNTGDGRSTSDREVLDTTTLSYDEIEMSSEGYGDDSATTIVDPGDFVEEIEDVPAEGLDASTSTEMTDVESETVVSLATDESIIESTTTPEIPIDVLSEDEKHMEETSHEEALADQAGEELQRDSPGHFNFYQHEDLEIVNLKSEVTTDKHAKTKDPLYTENDVTLFDDSSTNDEDVRELEELMKKPDQHEFFRKLDEKFGVVSDDKTRTKIVSKPREEYDYRYLSNSLDRSTIENTRKLADPSNSSTSETNTQEDNSVTPLRYTVEQTTKQGAEQLTASTNMVLVNVTIASENAKKPLYVVSVSVPTNSETSSININVPPYPKESSSSNNSENEKASNHVTESIEKSLASIQKSLGTIEKTLGLGEKLPDDIEVMSAKVIEASKLVNASLANKHAIINHLEEHESKEALVTDKGIALTLPPPPKPPSSPPPPVWAGGECECFCPCMDLLESVSEEPDPYWDEMVSNEPLLFEDYSNTTETEVEDGNATTTPMSVSEDEMTTRSDEDDIRTKCEVATTAMPPEPIILILEGEGMEKDESMGLFRYFRKAKFSGLFVLCLCG